MVLCSLSGPTRKPQGTKITLGELMFDNLSPGANLTSTAPAKLRQESLKLCLGSRKAFCNPVLRKSAAYFFSASGRADTPLVNKGKHLQGILNRWKEGGGEAVTSFAQLR